MTNEISEADIAFWRTWIGKSQTEEQYLDAESLRKYAAALGEPLDVEAQFPSLGHWAWFLPIVSRGDLGVDGHPAKGGFLPPVSLPRRMFAAARIEFTHPLETGRPARRTETVADVRHKSGRSGDLVFVEVTAELEQAGRCCISERRTFVYRAAGGTVPPIAETDLGPAAPGSVWQPNEVDLFRFSAATFNGHRIHYDLEYSRNVEGYAGLVVHGPFTASKLFSFALEQSEQDIRAFEFRAQAPILVGQPIRFEQGSDPTLVLARRCDGEVAMQATIEF